MQLLYKDTSLVSQKDLEHAFDALSEYQKHLSLIVQKEDMAHAESSINVVNDETAISQIKSLKEELVSDILKYIVVIGIGGSNLGAKAVYDALLGANDTTDPKRLPKMLFLDTVNPINQQSLIELVETLNSPEEILVCATSKSGGTTETISNVEFFMSQLLKKGSSYKNRLVIISDPHSKLWDAAKNEGIHVLDHPKIVGGRFSVLTAVGLFPLACAGVNIDALLEGAKNMRKRGVSEKLQDNDSALSAIILAEHQKQGRDINVNFFFHNVLESIGKWYRQLMGESIGKEHDIDGKQVFTGITPIVSIGSTDLHSMGQLYLGGPKDKVTTFVHSKKLPEVTVPEQLLFPGLVSDIEGKTMAQILEAILDGVKAAYKKQGLAFMQIELDEISEKEIGAYLQFKMIEMMYLGHLLHVNAFDQPNVESYKVETREILKLL